MWREPRSLPCLSGHSGLALVPSRLLPAAPGDDPQHVSVVGEGTCCLYRLEEGHTLRALPNLLSKRDAPQYACHAWLLDNDAEGVVVVGTRKGEVLVVAEGDVWQAVALEEGCGVEAVAAYGKVRGVGGGDVPRCGYAV